MLLWGAVGSGMFLSSVLTGCIGSRVRGGSLKFQSVMTWAGLILIVAKKAYLAFLSWSFSLLASFSLLLNILKAIFRRSLWGGLRPFSSWHSFRQISGADWLMNWTCGYRSPAGVEISRLVFLDHLGKL